MKMLKSTVTKKVIVCFHLLYIFGFYNLGEGVTKKVIVCFFLLYLFGFYNLGEENFQK